MNSINNSQMARRPEANRNIWLNAAKMLAPLIPVAGLLVLGGSAAATVVTNSSPGRFWVDTFPWKLGSVVAGFGGAALEVIDDLRNRRITAGSAVRTVLDIGGMLLLNAVLS